MINGGLASRVQGIELPCVGSNLSTDAMCLHRAPQGRPNFSLHAFHDETGHSIGTSP
jgi:hypothetical protein